MYDKLVIHSKAEQSDMSHLSSDISKLMRKHSYKLPYSVEPKPVFKPHIKVDFGKIEHGNRMKLESEEKKFVRATLGTFVRIKQKTEEGDSGKLYAVTCGHCVMGCKPEVQVARVTEQFESFGTVLTEYTTFDEKQYERDIAFINVDEDKKVLCNTKVRKPTDLEPTSSWKVYNEYLKLGTPVYMIGSVSSVVEGYIVRVDGEGDLANTIFVRPKTGTAKRFM